MHGPGFAYNHKRTKRAVPTRSRVIDIDYTYENDLTNPNYPAPEGTVVDKKLAASGKVPNSPQVVRYRSVVAFYFDAFRILYF